MKIGPPIMLVLAGCALAAEAALPSATTLAPTILTGNSATLNGSANPNGVEAVAWFEWGLSQNYGNQTAPVTVGSDVNPSPSTATLGGLAAGVVYHYRLVVSNSIGLSRGQDQILWWPVLQMNVAAQTTNECHVSFTEPVQVTAGPAQFDAGYTHNYAVKPDGSLRGWGGNSHGQLFIPTDLTNMIAVAAGLSHTLGLRADGTVRAWGENDWGQTNTPAGLSNVVTIAVGERHNLALLENGTVVAWGDNSSGQTNVPPGATAVTTIAAGFYHSIALRADGTVVAWGGNYDGQINVPPGLNGVVAICAGVYHTLALKADGSLVGWGKNTAGQSSIPPEATNVVALAAGENHSLVLRTDGSVFAWGDNTYNQKTVPAGATNIVAIAAGAYHSLALRADGTMLAWGYNGYSQTSIPANLPIQNLPLVIANPVDANTPGTYSSSYSVTNAFGATASTNRTAVVVDTQRPALTILGANPLLLGLGSAFTDPGATATDLCAGSLTANIIVTGTVDTNTTGIYTINYSVTDPTGNITQTTRTVLVGLPQANTFLVSNLFNQSALLSGTVNPCGADTAAWFEWGTSIAYTTGQIPVTVGNGTNVVPVSGQLNGLTQGVLYHSRLVASNAAGISRGENRMFWLPGLRPNGLATVTNQCHVAYADAGVRPTALVALTGGNWHSVLLRADGRVFSWGYQSQTNTPAGATNVIAIAAGGYHSLALRRDGSIVAWGQSVYGEANIPPSATNLVAVAAYTYNSLALRSDGRPLAWGNDYVGQTTVPASATNGVAIACGYYLNLFARRDGTVVAWGTGPTNVPAAASNVVALAAGDSHAVALRSDGRVIAWGENTSGQTNVPASVTNVIAIASGAAHNLALRADGRVIAWGGNSAGQTNVPVAATNIIAIGAGNLHSLALRADGAVFAWGLDSYGSTTTNGLLPLNLPVATVNPVDANTPGNYAVNYAVTNFFGAVATTNRTVVVRDSLQPVISLAGTNPLMLLAGSPFTEPGATAIDLCAGDLSSSIIFGGVVNQNDPGSYTRTYSVTDPAGNLRTINRTVVVVTQPLLTEPAQVAGPFQFTVTNTPGARFTVQAATNLSAPGSWIVLGPMAENPAGIFKFTDLAATNWPQRFYRVTCP